MNKYWKSWGLPPAPDKGCSTNKKKNWVMDCDIALGVEHLGGITGSFNLVNSDAFDVALDTVVQMLRDYHRQSRFKSASKELLLLSSLVEAHPHEALCEYVFNFSLAAWPLIECDKRFASWAIKQNGNWENPTSMLLGACLALVANNVHPNLQSSPPHKWWQFWKTDNS